MEHLVAPDDLYLVATGGHVRKGEQVEVDDETAVSLKEQGWVSLRSLAAKKAAARRAHETEVEDEPAAVVADEEPAVPAEEE